LREGVALDGIENMIDIDFRKTKQAGKIVATRQYWLIDNILLVMLAMLSTGFGLKVYVAEVKFQTGDIEKMVFWGLFFVSTALAFHTGRKIKSNRKLALIKTQLSKKTARMLIDRIVKDEGWMSLRSNGDFMIAKTRSKWLAAQEIVILPEEEQIRINVRLEPGPKGRFPFSFGRNKRLIKKIEQRLKTPSDTKQSDQPAV
jgi:hypothetical protein